MGAGIQKYYGLYNATIISERDDGRYFVKVDSISQGNLVARLSLLAGGNDATTGINAPPDIGAKCVVSFEQGDVKSPVIIGFINSKNAGRVGKLKAGEIFLRTKRGTQLALNEEDFILNTTRGDGLKVNNGELSLRHRKYSLYATSDKVRQEAPGIIYYYESGQAIKKYAGLYESFNDYRSETNGERIDNVTGNFTLKSLNNLNLKGSQVNLVGSEELNFSSRNDTAFMTNTFSVTASTDIYLGSVIGNAELATNAGFARIAAGTVSTAETGVLLSAAEIFLSQIGTIEITNNVTSTEYSILGTISENALLGFSATYGPTGMGVTTAGPVSYDTSLTFSVRALGGFDIYTSSIANISATLGISLNSAGYLTISAASLMSINVSGPLTIQATTTAMTSSVLSITSPLMTITPSAPILGVKVMTLLGPQFIIPSV